LRRAAIAFGAGLALCIGASLALDLSALGAVLLTLPFALIGFYALVGLLRGRALRLVWFVQALLTLLAWHESAGSSSSTEAIVFIVPLLAGPAVATLLAAVSGGWHAARLLRLETAP
jgi:hypothetical protein